YSHINHLHLHSFPTRRSSDLASILHPEPLSTLRSSTARMDQSWSPAKTRAKPKQWPEMPKQPPRASRPASSNPAIENCQQTCIPDRKSTRLNSSHVKISYAVF